VGTCSQEKLNLDWDVLERAFDTLLHLAPAALRSPPGFVDSIYEQKRAIKRFVELELRIEDMIIKKEIEALGTENTDTTVSDNEG